MPLAVPHDNEFREAFTKRLIPVYMDLVEAAIGRKGLKITLPIGQIGLELVRACATSEGRFPDTYDLPRMLANRSLHLRTYEPSMEYPLSKPDPEGRSMLMEAMSIVLRQCSEPDLFSGYWPPSLGTIQQLTRACEDVLSVDELESNLLAAINIQRSRYAGSPAKCSLTLLQEVFGLAMFYHRTKSYGKCRDVTIEVIALSKACVCNQRGVDHPGDWSHANILAWHAECLVDLSLADEAHEAFRLAIAAQKRFLQTKGGDAHSTGKHHLLQMLRSYARSLRDDPHDVESLGILKECVALDRSASERRRRRFGFHYIEQTFVQDLEDLANHRHAQRHGIDSCNLLQEGIQICRDARKYHNERDNLGFHGHWGVSYGVCLTKYASALQDCGRLTEAYATLGDLVSFLRSECAENSPPYASRVRRLVRGLSELEKLSAQATGAPELLELSREARLEKEALLLRYPGLLDLPNYFD